MQVSGEAVYTSDIGAGTAQLFAAPVTSSEALAVIEDIDASHALEARSDLAPQHQLDLSPEFYARFCLEKRLRCYLT